MRYNRWKRPILIICVMSMTMNQYVLAQKSETDTKPAHALSMKAVHLAVQLNLATSKMDGTSPFFPLNRITRFPLTSIGLLAWIGDGPVSLYLTAGANMGEYQLTKTDYRDRVALYWGYAGAGLMLGSSAFKFYDEFEPVFYFHQNYTVLARDTDGRHWVHATDLDLFPKWQFRNSLGIRFLVSKWWIGTYYQFSFGKIKRPNILEANKLHFRTWGASVWIPIAKITW